MESPRIKIGIFLQVRLNSSRLSRKALLPLIDGNVIQHAMRALRTVPADVYAILTDEQSSQELKKYAKQEDFEVFIGPQENVLSRYCLAAEYFNVLRIVRATGDNPLVSPMLTKLILLLHHKKQAELSHFIGMPLGTGVEIIETKSLKKTLSIVKDPFEKEHLTTHFYRNRDKFKIIEDACPIKCYLPEARVSLDTKEDYELIKLIFSDLYKQKPIETDRIVTWFKKEKIYNFNEGKIENKNITNSGFKKGIGFRPFNKMPISFE